MSRIASFLWRPRLVSLQPEVGSIYLMRDGELYKIGRSVDVQRRLRTFRTANPNIRLAHHFPARNMYYAEDTLHKRYAHRRVRGTEWFRLSRREAGEIKRIRRM